MSSYKTGSSSYSTLVHDRRLTQQATAQATNERIAISSSLVEHSTTQTKVNYSSNKIPKGRAPDIESYEVRGGLYERENDPASTLSEDDIPIKPHGKRPKKPKSKWRAAMREKIKRREFDDFEEEKVERKPLRVRDSDIDRPRDQIKRRKIETTGGPTNKYGLYDSSSDEEMWGLREEAYLEDKIQREYDEFLRD